MNKKQLTKMKDYVCGLYKFGGPKVAAVGAVVCVGFIIYLDLYGMVIGQ